MTRPGPEYPARTLRFPDDRDLGQVRIVSPDRTPADPIPAQGEVEVPAGHGAALFGTVTDSADLAGADGLTHFFLAEPIDRATAEAIGRMPYLRQISADTAGLGVEGFAALAAAPYVAAIELRVTAEDDGGVAILERAVAADEINVNLEVGAAALPRLCELAAAGEVPERVRVEVDADERALLPLRKIWPDREIGGVKYSPKALARLEASFADS